MSFNIVRTAQTLAVWRAFESGAMGTMELADRKAAEAKASEDFVTAAYGIAFGLVQDFVHYKNEIAYRADIRSKKVRPLDTDAGGGEITTTNEVRYSAETSGGGFLIQKMDLDPDNLGIRLLPGEASIENFLQLMIDLPELLEILPTRLTKSQTSCKINRSQLY